MRNLQLKKILLRIVGVIFILSGIGKLGGFSGFVETLISYPIINSIILARILGSLICFIEIYIGFELLSLKNIKRNLNIILILVSFFTIIYSFGLLFLDISNCGCFGVFSYRFFENPYFLYIKNILIIIVAIYIKKSNAPFDDEKENRVIYQLFAVLIAYILGNVASISLSGKSLFEDSFKTEYSSLISELNLHNDTTYFVFVFSYSCSHCINSIENIKKYENNNNIDKVIYLTYNSDSLQRAEFNKYFNLENKILEKNYSFIAKLTNHFPTGFYIKNSRVEKSLIGQMPSEMLLQDKLFYNY